MAFEQPSPRAAPPPPPPPKPPGGGSDAFGVLGSFINPRQGDPNDEPGQTRSVVFRGPPAAYIEGDEWAQFVGLSPEAAWSWQRRLVDAGLLKGEFARGMWDANTAQAMGAAMSYGNAWGTNYATALDRLASAPQQDDAAQMPPRNPFMAPAYQAPTPAMLAQEVKGYLDNRLGRTADDADLADLTAAFARFHRGDYQEQVAVGRSEHGRAEDARMNEAAAGLAGDDEAAAAAGPGEFAATGPAAVAAEFAEYFDRKYADELAFNARRDARGESDQSFLGSLAAVDRLMGA